MCPADDSHLTLEFDDHFVIKPAITFGFTVAFEENRLGERGAAVAQGFEYNSNSNSDWLSADAFLSMVEDMGL